MKNKINIRLLVLILSLCLLSGCASQLKKITKTHNVKTEAECIEKKGYWYEEKCWANFNKIDEGILPEHIDDVVNTQLKAAEHSVIYYDGETYPLRNASPGIEGNRFILLATFNKNNAVCTIVSVMDKSALKKNTSISGKMRINAETTVYDSDIFKEKSQPNIIAKGNTKVEIVDENKFKVKISGTLMYGKNKIPVDYELSEDIYGTGTSTLEVKSKKAYLNGNLGAITYRQIKDLIRQHPEVKTLVFENVPGSVNDAVNLHTGRIIHEAGLITMVPYYGIIASGGVDLFCAGKNRIIEKGARLGIHSWSSGTFDADDFPEDHPVHRYQTAYYEMCLGEKGRDFYFHTLKAASAYDIHWMSEDEILKWNIVGKMTSRTKPENYPDLPDIVGYYFGNPASGTVIVNAQGGPETTLFTKEFEEIFIKYGKINPDSIFAVNIHQVQTQHPDRFTKSDISFEQAVEYGERNTKRLAGAIDYFKAKGKKVIVVGISYGAFLVEDYLARYENRANGYFILAGRLNMPKEVWMPFSEGKIIRFKDGKNFSEIMTPGDILVRNMSRLAAAYGYRRYIKLLKDTNMSNVVYAYGLKDEQVGRLSQNELDFLKKNNVRIFKGQGGHTETIFEFMQKGMRALKILE